MYWLIKWMPKNTFAIKILHSRPATLNRYSILMTSLWMSNTFLSIYFIFIQILQTNMIKQPL